MPAKINEERGPPRLDTDNAPITWQPFIDGRKLMFWGPNQAVVDSNPATYNPPSGFKNYSPLVLPRVARFLSLNRITATWHQAHLNPLDNTFNIIKPDLSVLDTTWPSIRDELTARYTGKYFYAQKYQRQNMLNAVAPTEGRETEKWFGTNILNVVVISEPIAYTNPSVNKYTLTWPIASWTATLGRITPYLHRWPRLRTVFYYDRYNMQRLVTNNFRIPEDNVSTPPVPELPTDSDVLPMMDYSITQLTQFCTDNSEWAEYGGTITSQPTSEYFHALLDDHLRYTPP
jgi:hypothetical protein